MSAHIQRALLLLHQQRTDLAEQELRMALAEEPHNSHAHALLALCLRRQDKFEAATEEAQQAIGLSPDEAYPHYVLSVVMAARNRFAEAKSAIQDAIRIEPEEADYWGQLAAVELELRDWNAALAAAERGLQIDAEHVGCTNLRVQALTKLGRRTEADAAVEAALRREPENAYTHANRGWTLLEKGDPAKALEHFREALRLNPELEMARAGIVEALKARYRIYRVLLAFMFWMSRLSRRAQWGVILGGWVAYQLTREAAAQSPTLKMVLRPVIVLYVCFVLLTWIGRPIFNTMLRFNKFGRMALSNTQRWQSTVVSVLLVLAIACGVDYAIGGDIVPELSGIVFAISAMLSSVTFECSPGWPRRAMTIYTVALLLLGLTSAGLWQAAKLTGPPKGDVFIDLASHLTTPILLLMVGTPIIANVMAQAQPKR